MAPIPENGKKQDGASAPSAADAVTAAAPVAPMAAGAAPGKVEFADPHDMTGPQEAEVTRVRRLTGFWRWLLIVLTAATILLCINQQFTLRFFVGYTQLNTEYFYLLIVLMLPFTYLIFPGSATAPLDRVPWYDVALFVATVVVRRLPDAQHPQGRRARLGVQRRAARRDRRRPRDVVPADGGAPPHGRLEPAASACCRSRSIRCLPGRNGSGP